MNLFLAVLLLTASGTAYAEVAAAGYGVELDGFPYPHAVERFRFTSQGQDLQMGYMDVKPKKQPNGHTVVLMHGKNFCGATWESTIAVLADAGYRVVVPDQVGFCTSTKPACYQHHGIAEACGRLSCHTYRALDRRNAGDPLCPDVSRICR
jgi:pimeloyl-ACP methyl ester carboxylesterase